MTLKRFHTNVKPWLSEPRKRATVYLDADLHRAIKAKSSLSSITISELISEAVKDSFRSDAAGIKALEVES